MYAFIMKAEYDADLDGIVLTLNSGRIAQCHWGTETNRLSANYNDEYLRRYTEYDSDDLTAEENEIIDQWVNENKWQIERDDDHDTINSGLGWTNRRIKDMAIEAIKKMNDNSAHGMIVACAEKTQFMNWEIRINSEGGIYSDSELHDYKDDETTLAKNDVSSHGPSCFLEWFGFIENDENEWSLPDDTKISTQHIIDYLNA